MSPDTVGQARILRLEQAGLNAMPAYRVAWNGGWIIRISAGGARRRNSVTCLDPADAGSVDHRIERIEADYGRAGLPAIFRLSPLAPPALDAALEKRGYRTVDETLVLHMELPERGERGRFAATPSEAWFQVAGNGLSAQAARELRDSVPLLVPPALYPLLEHEGAPACAARVVLDGRLAGIFDVATLPAARRSGLARRIMFETLGAAAARGARAAWLQVVASNQAAVALYSSLGFIEAYRYRYRVRR
jgi:ribosomal protein S18 acetylase RimI-like enzyme